MVPRENPCPKNKLNTSNFRVSDHVYSGTRE